MPCEFGAVHKKLVLAGVGAPISVSRRGEDDLPSPSPRAAARRRPGGEGAMPQTDYAFLHGGGQGGWVWADTIEALALQSGDGSARALALDVPGCGAKRDRDVAGLGMADIAAELVADIAAAGMRDVVLVGHSQAGQAMPFMAAHRPGLFRRMVYVACSIPLMGQSLIDMMGTGLHGAREDQVGWPFDRATTDAADGFRRLFCNDMTAAQAARLASRAGADRWPPPTYSMTDWCYPSIGTVPSRYVACLRDAVLPMAWQETFARRFMVQAITRIDAGHQAMVTRPHTLAEVLLADDSEGETR
jgi:pimeloyl-ACP methyl ester carboxylesterase